MQKLCNFLKEDLPLHGDDQAFLAYLNLTPDPFPKEIYPLPFMPCQYLQMGIFPFFTCEITNYCIICIFLNHIHAPVLLIHNTFKE